MYNVCVCVYIYVYIYIYIHIYIYIFAFLALNFLFGLICSFIFVLFGLIFLLEKQPWILPRIAGFVLCVLRDLRIQQGHGLVAGVLQ